MKSKAGQALRCIASPKRKFEAIAYDLSYVTEYRNSACFNSLTTAKKCKNVRRRESRDSKKGKNNALFAINAYRVS